MIHQNICKCQCFRWISGYIVVAVLDPDRGIGGQRSCGPNRRVEREAFAGGPVGRLAGADLGNYVGMMRIASGVAGVAVVLGLLAGCGSAQREAGASEVAEAFSSALDAGDAAAACAVLAPETSEALAASEGEACETALGSLELAGGPVLEVVVWGDRAQARTDADVLFLTEFESGWFVSAAGCAPQGDRPYQCEVSS
jgi:hypothetical protein